MATLPAKSKKTPPKGSIDSKQFDLFTTFLSNDDQKVSNSVNVWESVPKYFFTRRQVSQLRTPVGHADPYEFSYIYDGIDCTVTIQPALIKQEDGRYKACFPGVTEELIEEALKKILVTQNHGIHNPKKKETWVSFTLRMVQRELKERGRDRNLAQIKHAVLVMSRCLITLQRGGREVWTGSILQDFTSVDRDAYLDNTSSLHFARLPAFVSHAINQLEYRQFNYQRLMSCNEQLTRWIYKQLIHRYLQASYSNTYHFLFSGIAHSGLLQHGRTIDKRRKVAAALAELVEQGVLLSYTVTQRKSGRKIVDEKYTVHPAPAFIAEQKAANKRASLGANQVAGAELPG